MKLAICALAPVIVALAQQTSVYTSTGTDINGNSVTLPTVVESKSRNSLDMTEKMPSINGGQVPRERIEEHVISEDSSGRVIERIARPYDQTGQPGPPMKTIIEERKTGDGMTIKSSTYRGDVNGRMNPSERIVTEIHKSASGQTTDVTVERPSIEGPLEAVEKRSSVRTASANGYEENTEVYRRGENGFYQAAKLVTNHSENNGTATENTAEYQPGSSGNMELQGQTVTRVTKQTDGSSVTETDKYSPSLPGRVSSSDSGLKLEARQTLTRSVDASGGVRETVTVRRANPSDPNNLGSPQVLSETVCKGGCH